MFVHGIYGSRDTFYNRTTNFDWPSQFPASISVKDTEHPNGQDRQIDVYRLNYRSAMLSWARGSNPNFDDLAEVVYAATQEIRLKNYRSIGFVAHSLGGNVVSTYLHLVKSQLGHPQLSENAYVIMLATPMRGADIADITSEIKVQLRMKDDLLNSLKDDNLYLRMLDLFSEATAEKGSRYLCRPVDLYGAFEAKETAWIIQVVSEEQTAKARLYKRIKDPTSFELDHSQMAKPTGVTDPLYEWVLGDVTAELVRLDAWPSELQELRELRPSAPHGPEYGLCGLIPFIPE